jgi:hypothetical protein
MLSQVGSTEEHNGGATLDDASMPGQIFSQKGCPWKVRKSRNYKKWHGGWLIHGRPNHLARLATAFREHMGIKVEAENLFEPLVSTKITPGTMQQGQRFITIPNTYPLGRTGPVLHSGRELEQEDQSGFEYETCKKYGTDTGWRAIWYFSGQTLRS